MNNFYCISNCNFFTGSKSRNRHPLVLPPILRQLALDAGRPSVHTRHVHRHQARPQKTAVPPFHYSRRHRKHQSRIQFGQRHHSAQKFGDSYATINEKRI